MDCRERIRRYLLENNVPFKLEEHYTAYTAQEVAEAEHVPGQRVAKVVMVKAESQVLMLVVPAVRRVDLDMLGDFLGKRSLRLATEEEFTSLFPDCEVGAMPPFGNLFGLPVYVDVSLTEDPTIVFQAGSHEETMEIAYSDYARLVQPAVGNFSRHV